MVFYGYSGTDSCGRKNVAISNEMAGDGEGTARALGSIFGKVTCYPIHLRKTAFASTPLTGRLRFSPGPEGKYEVMYGLCSVADYDGSLVKGTDAAATSGAVRESQSISRVTSTISPSLFKKPAINK